MQHEPDEPTYCEIIKKTSDEYRQGHPETAGYLDRYYSEECEDCEGYDDAAERLGVPRDSLRSYVDKFVDWIAWNVFGYERITARIEEQAETAVMEGATALNAPSFIWDATAWREAWSYIEKLKKYSGRGFVHAVCVCCDAILAFEHGRLGKIAKDCCLSSKPLPLF